MSASSSTPTVHYFHDISGIKLEDISGIKLEEDDAARLHGSEADAAEQREYSADLEAAEQQTTSASLKCACGTSNCCASGGCMTAEEYKEEFLRQERAAKAAMADHTHWPSEEDEPCTFGLQRGICRCCGELTIEPDEAAY
jgi:hypothetical protein